MALNSQLGNRWLSLTEQLFSDANWYLTVG